MKGAALWMAVAIALPLLTESWVGGSGRANRWHAARAHGRADAISRGRSARRPCTVARLSCRQVSATLSEEQRAYFWRHGFVLVPNVLSAEEAKACRDRYQHMFAGVFDTGTYPDEWHWREGISLPDAVREICNGWKSDTCIQSTVLSARFGRIACELMQWQTVRRVKQSC
jgi:hypothetical protein